MRTIKYSNDFRIDLTQEIVLLVFDTDNWKMYKKLTKSKIKYEYD